MTTRTPDYQVKALNKRTDEKGKIGVAWINEDKSITMVLHGFITIEADRDVIITLFPN